jgi:hypothetical protein
MPFRRQWTSQVWHWCPECSLWPKDYPDGYAEERATAPTGGELCNECLTRQPLFDGPEFSGS